MPRQDPRETIWNRANAELGFLIRDAGFSPQVRTANGVAFHRPDLSVLMEFVDGREPELATRLRMPGGQRGVGLGCLYLACGCGVAQDVSSNVTNQRTLEKRIAQHAKGLRCVLAHLNADNAADLLDRCVGRLFPSDAPPRRRTT